MKRELEAAVEYFSWEERQAWRRRFNKDDKVEVEALALVEDTGGGGQTWLCHRTSQ